MSPERTLPTVLIVDDSAADRRLVGGLLERSGGISVDMAKDGKEAIDHFQTRVPELAVTDLIMPEMDGLALVAAVKSEFPLVPVVLMTARGNEEIALAAPRRGRRLRPQAHPRARSRLTVKRILAAAREDRSLSRLMHRMVNNQSSFVLHNDPEFDPPLAGILAAGPSLRATGR